MRKEIEGERCGVYVDAADPGHFAKAIKPFVEDDALLNAYQDAARKLAEKKYSRKMLGAMYADIVAASSGTGKSDG